MTEPLPFGVYETVITEPFGKRISATDGEASYASLTDDALATLLAHHVQQTVHRQLAGLSAADQVNLVRQILGQIDPQETVSATHVLHAITEHGNRTPRRPSHPFTAGALLTNARDEPNLGSELALEMETADAVDLLCAFVKKSGVRIIEHQLAPLRRRGVRLRVITTTYMGATEREALDILVNEFGAEVRVKYEISSTRLHAKSWLFHRKSGFNTAYVGSSNLSGPALVDGLEWNVRLAEATNSTEIAKFSKIFDSYWSSPEFEPYDPELDRARLDAALHSAGGYTNREHAKFASNTWSGPTPTPPIANETGGIGADQVEDSPVDSSPEPANLSEVDPSLVRFNPYPYQRKMLESLQTERKTFDRHRNLIVAATGTGKTVVAALDYAQLEADLSSRPTLLFVAHRKEILAQARATYRSVLGDKKFGELMVGGERPVRGNHVFASIQSLSRSATTPDPVIGRSWDIIVIDEFHHAEAETYQRLLRNYSAIELLGLTATPERADGVDVAKFFDGRTAAELRLWDALGQDLLCPFHYYGVSDDTDLSSIKWTPTGYDAAELSNLYTGNDARSLLIYRALKEKVLDPKRMKALGFCVTVEHAKYMAAWFSERGIPSISITADTTQADRETGISNLRTGHVNCIFTVDVFNEGIDIPEVDTVLMLRPTKSSTVYIQQLGRGLRRSPGKPVLTVLDFVGHHRADFDISGRYMLMTGRSRKELQDDLELGHPTLPGASRLVLDEITRKEILDSVRRAAANRRIDALVADVRSVGVEKRLAKFLAESNRTLDDVYRPDRSWHTVLIKAKGEPAAPKDELTFFKKLHRLRTVDDPDRIEEYTRIALAIRSGEHLRADDPWARMLVDFMLPNEKFETFGQAIEVLAKYPRVLDEIPELMEAARSNIELLTMPLGGKLSDLPLRSHARYQREELLSALQWTSLSRRPGTHREGVVWSENVETDLFLINLHKDTKSFTESTMYRDIPVTHDLFDWESQSTTSQHSKTGQRYINHLKLGTNILLAVRNAPKDEIGTAPFMLLGPASLVSYQGERPIQFRWQLQRSMPADVLAQASVISA